MRSPITGREMKTVHENRKWNFRGEEYEYVHTSWLCEDSGEQFTTDESDTSGFVQVTNQYRERYGIPFRDEIVSVRRRYGVSAAKMSVILGMGANQWRMYEAGEVPSVSNGRMIRSIMNPKVFMELVESSRHLLSDKDYSRISGNMDDIISQSAGYRAEQYAMKRIYGCRRGADNGYGSLSLPRLKNILLYILDNCGEVFCTKMNKMLFYIDFFAYRNTGTAMTGLRYKAITYGPVPEHWDRVYCEFDEIVQEPRTVGNWEGSVLMAREKADISLFTEDELSAMRQICEKFKECSSRSISDLSHEEQAWIECHELHGYIPFRKAFALKGV